MIVLMTEQPYPVWSNRSLSREIEYMNQEKELTGIHFVCKIVSPLRSKGISGDKYRCKQKRVYIGKNDHVRTVFQQCVMNHVGRFLLFLMKNYTVAFVG